MGDLEFHPGMKRQVRAGTPQQQGISSYRLAQEALTERDFGRALDLGRHCQTETQLARRVYPEWLTGIREFLVREGVAESELRGEEDDVLAKVLMPTGRPPDTDQDCVPFDAAIERFAAACAAGDAEVASSELEEARQIWLLVHDRVTDHITGMFDIVFRRVGEDRIGDVWDELMQDWYSSRDAYDPALRPWPESLQILLPDTTESLRGHMTGLSRSGDIEVIEESDRWIFRFEPCGSGGRTVKGDPDEGSPPRAEPPFNFAVTTRPHDWAWGKEGVCLYCVHCCQLQERVPIQKFGYPVRVVDPPIWPADRETGLCTWSVYKDPALVPTEAWERVGAVAPPDRRTGEEHGSEA
jgi:hypothetical protein